MIVVVVVEVVVVVVEDADPPVLLVVELLLVVVVVATVPGHVPSIRVSFTRNTFASFFVIVLLGGAGKRTWYRSPPVISKSTQPDAPRFGGRRVMPPVFPET